MENGDLTIRALRTLLPNMRSSSSDKLISDIIQAAVPSSRRLRPNERQHLLLKRQRSKMYWHMYVSNKIKAHLQYLSITIIYAFCIYLHLFETGESVPTQVFHDPLGWSLETDLSQEKHFLWTCDRDKWHHAVWLVLCFMVLPVDKTKCDAVRCKCHSILWLLHNMLF